MKRTTVVLPDDLAALLDIERRRRDLSTAKIIREALAAYLHGETARPRNLRIAALGHSGHRDTARRAEDILASEWADDRNR